MTQSTKCWAANSRRSAFFETHYEPERLSSNEIRVRVQTCGISRDDVEIWQGYFGDRFFPFVAGREIVGEVIELGSSGLRHSIGSKVLILREAMSCRSCQACLAGNTYLCSNVYLTHIGRRGGLSTEVNIDSDFAIPSPFSAEIVAAAGSGLAAFRVLRECKARQAAEPNQRVAVIGLGGVGHIAVQLARAMGLDVHVISTQPEKKTDAISLGATDFILASDETSLRSRKSFFDLILYCAVGPFDLPATLTRLRSGGQLAILGRPVRELTFNSALLLHEEKQIRTAISGSCLQLKNFFDFAVENNVRARCEFFQTKEIDRAFDLIVKNQNRFRAIVNVDT